jgi:hypothetical protein
MSPARELGEVQEQPAIGISGGILYSESRPGWGRGDRGSSCRCNGGIDYDRRLGFGWIWTMKMERLIKDELMR